MKERPGFAPHRIPKLQLSPVLQAAFPGWNLSYGSEGAQDSFLSAAHCALRSSPREAPRSRATVVTQVSAGTVDAQDNEIKDREHLQEDPRESRAHRTF